MIDLQEEDYVDFRIIGAFRQIKWLKREVKKCPIDKIVKKKKKLCSFQNQITKDWVDLVIIHIKMWENSLQYNTYVHSIHLTSYIG